MTETQRAPILPPPAFLGHTYPRGAPPQLPPLPPLSIPPSPKGSNPHRDKILSANTPTLVPRPQYSSTQVPIQRLLSNTPYTPTRSEAALSPILSRSPRLGANAQVSQSTHRAGHGYDARETDHAEVKNKPSLSAAPARRALAPLPSPVYSRTMSSTHPQSVPPPAASVSSTPIPSVEPEQAAFPEVGSYEQPVYRSQQQIDHLRYNVHIRQQPIAARACGFGERDRRVVDPPPILQLTVTDSRTGTVDSQETIYPMHVVHCSLWDADGKNDETALVQQDRRQTRRLMGQLVASPSIARDEHGVEGTFFCFPDLSCRTHGRYRLRFLLMRIDPMNLHPGSVSPVVGEALSDVFTVYTAKDFPGMRASSALTRTLKAQGINIQVKKGNEKANRRGLPLSDNEDAFDDNDGGENSKAPPKKRRRKDD